MNRLTKAEEQVMQIVWSLKEAVVKDVVDQFDEPRPAYTTVATVLRVLKKKGFLGHKAIGNTHLFYPIVTKKDYTRFQFKYLLEDYFQGSFPKLATFFAHENNLSISELESMLKQAEAELQKEHPKKRSHE